MVTLKRPGSGTGSRCAAPAGSSSVDGPSAATTAVHRRAVESGVSPSSIVATVDGSLAFAFDVEPFRKFCLLGGYDDIGLTLRYADKIRAFEAERLAKKPWLARSMVS